MDTNARLKLTGQRYSLFNEHQQYFNGCMTTITNPFVSNFFVYFSKQK